jgi:hypothetical protein
MRRIILTTIGLLLAAAPVAALDKSGNAKDDVWEQNSKLLKQEGQNREPGEDGTFQGKPVVQGPADWSGIAASRSDSGTTGTSAGEAGSDR